MILSDIEILDALKLGDEKKTVQVLQSLVKESEWCSNDKIIETLRSLSINENIAIRFWSKKALANCKPQHTDLSQTNDGDDELSLELLYKKLETIKSSYILLSTIEKILKSRDDSVRITLCKYLDSCNDTIVISFLSKQLGLNYPDDEMLSFLSKFLKHKDARVIANTIEGIAVIQSPKTVILVSQLLGSKNHRIRANAAVALGKQDKAVAKETIDKMIHMTEEPHFIIAALYAISEIGSIEFIPYICELIENPLLKQEVEKTIKKLATNDKKDKIIAMASTISPEIGMKVEHIIATKHKGKRKNIFLRASFWAIFVTSTFIITLLILLTIIHVEKASKSKNTILMYTARHIQTAIASEILIKFGANTEARNKDGWTPIMIAARYNKNPKVAEALSRLGADIEARSKDGWTPIMIAAHENKNTKVIETLAKLGANIEAKDEDGNTPLIHASVLDANSKNIETLIKLGANIKARNKDGGTPIIIAAQYTTNPKVIETLVKLGAIIQDKDNMGFTTIACAAQNNTNPKIIEALVKLGADIKAKDVDGMTALSLAAQYNANPKILETLVKLGANIEAKSNNGITALMCAAESNINPKVIETLILLGANIEAKDNFGATALMHAGTISSAPEVIETLILLGANIEAKDNFGTTALMYAATTNTNLKVIETLVRLGANIEARSNNGITALMCAAESNTNEEVFETLAELEANISSD